MHLSGITAEMRPGAQNIAFAGEPLPLSSPRSGFRFMELAKGFEPPTL
jgi:hypothetical protein